VSLRGIWFLPKKVLIPKNYIRNNDIKVGQTPYSLTFHVSDALVGIKQGLCRGCKSDIVLIFQDVTNVAGYMGNGWGAKMKTIYPGITTFPLKLVPW
jgi:hypothetical protein